MASQPLPNLVVADPPWAYPKGICTPSSTKACASEHYSTSSLGDLVAHRPETAADAVLVMWTTGPKLAEAVVLIKEWGFKYIGTLFVWKKLTPTGRPNNGLGFYTSQDCEYVLLATKGRISKFRYPRTGRPTVSNVFEAPRREHSRKPEEFWTLLGQVFMLDAMVKLEMYARETRTGWTAFGNETTKFDAAAAADDAGAGAAAEEDAD